MATKHYDIKTFRSSESIGYLLKRAQARMQDVAESVFAPHDMSFVQWITMLKLREEQAGVTVRMAPKPAETPKTA